MEIGQRVWFGKPEESGRILTIDGWTVGVIADGDHDRLRKFSVIQLRTAPKDAE